VVEEGALAGVVAVGPGSKVVLCVKDIEVKLFLASMAMGGHGGGAQR
jgi:hypothetical protein